MAQAVLGPAAVKMAGAALLIYFTAFVIEAALMGCMMYQVKNRICASVTPLRARKSTAPEHGVASDRVQQSA